MREKSRIGELNSEKITCADHYKRQITINIDSSTIDYFKHLAEINGIPYQTLINLCLRDCADNKRQIQMSWH